MSQNELSHLAIRPLATALRNLDLLDWPIHAPYVNGGVIWYADTAGAHLFAETWQRNWLYNCEVTGRYRDQPALNYTLFSTPAIRLETLNHCWNAQLKMKPSLAKNAIIWHLYASSPRSKNRFDLCCQRVLSARQSCDPQSRMFRRLITASNPETFTGSLFRFRDRLLFKARKQIGLLVRTLPNRIIRFFRVSQ